MSETGAEPEAVAAKPGGSSALINRLAAEFDVRNYLEVGVATGATFLNVDIPRREAVDPHFRFPTEAYASDTTRFYEEPSDRYFARFPAEKQERFDLIFLDGLHTFEQTYRDFLNSLEVSHDRTIWVIDDTGPADAFSVMQNQREAVELRQLSNTSRVKPGAWHGDVFKVVFAIHDFMPAFSFASTAPGRIQTIVWRERRHDFEPLFNSLETITRMAYIDYLRHRPIMNLTRSDEIIARIKAAHAALSPTSEPST